MTVQVLGEPIAQAVPERMRERPVPVRAQRPQLVGDALVVAGGVAERESPNEAPPGLHEIRGVEFTARPRMLEQILRLLLDHGNPFGRETVQGVFRFEDRLVERASLGADVPSGDEHTVGLERAECGHLLLVGRSERCRVGAQDPVHILGRQDDREGAAGDRHDHRSVTVPLP